MGWSRPSLIAIVILLTHEVLPNLSELIIVRHPPTANGSTRKLTCLSEDDGSALIWNYKPEKSRENTFTNFKPAKPSTKDVEDCAIRNSTTCIAEWDRYGGWNVVSSFKNPMGPVFDYRWEGFKEFTFEKSVDEDEYQYVGEMKQSSYSSVFSVRGSRNVNIFLCRKKNMMAGPCLWINIGGLEGKQSTIQCCKGGAPNARAKESASCEPMTARKHEKNVIDEFEWRTFRLKWISDESTIEVYDETQNSPFLYKGIEPRQQSLGHVSIASDGTTQIRFHSYEYFLTKKRTKTISTKKFRYYDNFCIEILFGVCKECEIIVDMMGDRDKLLKSVKITDDGTSELDGMMTWNLVKIDLNLRNLTSQDVKLEMRSGSLDRNSDKRNDQWAMGGLRTCKSRGSLRASTITVRNGLRSDSTGEWPKTNCQRLSYDKSKSAVVYSFPMNSSPSCSDDRISQFTRELYETCGSWCEKFDEKSSVCKPIGCNCAYGFMGIKCDEECAEQPRKYNRTERSSRSEYYGRGNPTDTYYKCKNEIYLPPSCEKELEAPTPTIYGYSRASFSLTVDLEGDVKLNGVDFVITMAGSSPLPAKHTSRSNSSQSSTWRLIVADLAWDAEYVIYAIAYVSINRGPIPVESPRRQFTSTPWGARCFGIESVTETSFTIFAHTESEVTGCGTYGRVHHTLGMKKSTEKVYELKSGPLLPYTFTDLEANIKYQVIVDVPTFGIVYHNSVKTLESAPGKVTFLHTSSVTDNRVTLEWSPPAGRSRDGIEYEVSIKRDSLFGCNDKNIPELTQNERPAERVNSTKYIVEDLHPYAGYTASVTAVTPQRGETAVLSFRTEETSVPRSVVSNLTVEVKKLRVEWDEPEDCRTITSKIVATKLIIKSVRYPDVVTVDRSIWIPEKFYDIRKLAPYTDYKLRAYVVAWNNRVNDTAYVETQFRTRPSAPEAVRNLGIYDADYDTNCISLRWRPPNPPGGEIQSYHVLIEQNEMVLLNKSIEPSKYCEFQDNYVCSNNLQLLQDMPNYYEARVQVWAKNKDVEEGGVRNTLRFCPNFIYNEKPGTPMNFTAIHQYQGVVLLKWIPLRFPATKVTSFEIYVEVLEKHLRNNTYDQFPMTLNYTVGNKKIEYSEELPLLPSTKYRASIVSKNRRQYSSVVSEIEFSIPGSLGFAGQEEPELKNNASLIVINIPEVVNATTNTTLKVFVKGPSKCTRHDSSADKNQIEIVEEWLAAEYTVNNTLPKVLKISVEQHHGVKLNCSLRLNEIYTFLLIVNDWISDNTDEFETSRITLTAGTEPSSGMELIWLIIVGIIAASCLILLFVFYQKRKKLPRKISQQNILHLEISIPSTAYTTAPGTIKREPFSPNATQNRLIIGESSPDVTSYNLNSHPVRVEEFEEYTKEATATGLLNQQYEKFAKAVEKPCLYGALPENALKNRYKDRLPYDETRVVLETIDGIPDSDYINASYIRGYRKPRAYIATQGPKSKTVKDFWRMIWEKEVQVICMLANVMEAGKKKCEQYWPQVGTKVKYGKIYIKNEEHKVFADYTFRTFTLASEGSKRTVTHLHYTGWPDHGVPMYTQSLVAYLKKLLATPSGKGPVVVHCSAGVGRTGTIIVCDFCLRQAFAERIIDVPSVIKKIREDRPGMVDNPQQYLLAHLAIVESMVVEQTQIPCDDFLPEKISELRKQLPSDVKRLKDTVWQDRVLHTLGVASTSNTEQVIVGDRQIQVSRGVHGKNIINAVNVDGVKMKNQYLASRLPSTSSLPDFWKLIADDRIELVIILQRPDKKNSTYCDLTLGESTINPVAHIKVETVQDLQEKEHFTIKVLSLTETSESETRTQPVTVLTCIGWGNGKTGKPPTASALVWLWINSEKISRKESSTLVLCHDGVTASGLYLAMSFLLERMAVEKECDVISAVRAVRRSKIEFVKSLQQFQYLYDAAVNYVECFVTYSNFT